MNIALRSLRLATPLLFVSGVALAQNENIDLQWQGALAVAGQYLAHSSSYSGDLGLGIEEAMVHLQIDSKETPAMRARLGIGVRDEFNYTVALSPYSPVATGLQYGWIEYQRSDRRTWQMGLLKSHFGVESGFASDNPHILFGALNKTLSFFYPGLRLQLQAGDWQLYGEVSGPEVPNKSSGAGGILRHYGSNSYIKFNFLSAGDERSLAELAWLHAMSASSVGAVARFIRLYDDLDWRDDDAIAAAIYYQHRWSSVSLALRQEYFDDGNSGVYGYDQANVSTLTLTYAVSKNNSLRCEATYAESVNPVFKKDHQPEKVQYGLALQYLMRF